MMDERLNKPFVSVLFDQIDDTPADYAVRLEQEHADRANHWLYFLHEPSEGASGSVRVMGRATAGQGPFFAISPELNLFSFSASLDSEDGTAHFFTGSFEEIYIKDLSLSGSDKITIVLASSNNYRPNKMLDYGLALYTLA